MEITTLIIDVFSLITAVLTLICTWYFWRRSYKEWKTIKEFRKIDFSKENSFILMRDLYVTMRKHGVHIPNPYKDPILFSLYNVLENTYQEDE